MDTIQHPQSPKLASHDSRDRKNGDTFDSILPTLGTEIGFKDHRKKPRRLTLCCMLYAVMCCDAIARNSEIPCTLLLCDCQTKTKLLHEVTGSLVTWVRFWPLHHRCDPLISII